MNPVELSLLGGREFDQEENNTAILLEIPHDESVWSFTVLRCDSITFVDVRYYATDLSFGKQEQVIS